MKMARKKKLARSANHIQCLRGIDSISQVKKEKRNHARQVSNYKKINLFVEPPIIRPYTPKT